MQGIEYLWETLEGYRWLWPKKSAFD